MNNFIAYGRMTKNVEIRYPQNKPDMAIGSFGVAVNRKFEKDKTDFFNCVAFGKTAENLEKFFHKGDRILIQGEVNIDEFTDKNGNRVWATKVVVNNFDFIETKSEKGQAEKKDDGFLSIPDGLADEELPFA